MFFEKDDFTARIDMAAIGERCKNKVKVLPRGISALSFRVRGSVHLLCDNGDEVTTKSGEILYMPAGLGYEAEYSDSEIIFFHFSELCEISRHPEVYSSFDGDYVLSLFTKAVEIWQDKKEGYRMSTMSVFCEILSIIAKSSGKTQNYGQSYYKALSLLEDNVFDCELKISDICKKAYISETSFRRSFLKQFGISPIEFVIDRRLRKADILLSSTDLSIDKIAGSCGFSDSKYFSRLTRKRRGMSPSEIRKSKTV